MGILLPGGFSGAQIARHWVGFIDWHDGRKIGSRRVKRLKPLRDTMLSERKKTRPRGRASEGKVRPAGYHLRPQGQGVKGETILASGNLPAVTSEVWKKIEFRAGRRSALKAQRS